jgi:hypothetical protein
MRLNSTALSRWKWKAQSVKRYRLVVSGYPVLKSTRKTPSRRFSVYVLFRRHDVVHAAGTRMCFSRPAEQSLEAAIHGWAGKVTNFQNRIAEAAKPKRMS